jgi:hypothetical protein
VDQSKIKRNIMKYSDKVILLQPVMLMIARRFRFVIVLDTR